MATTERVVVLLDRLVRLEQRVDAGNRPARWRRCSPGRARPAPRRRRSRGTSGRSCPCGGRPPRPARGRPCGRRRRAVGRHLGRGRGLRVAAASPPAFARASISAGAGAPDGRTRAEPTLATSAGKRLAGERRGQRRRPVLALEEPATTSVGVGLALGLELGQPARPRAGRGLRVERRRAPRSPAPATSGTDPRSAERLDDLAAAGSAERRSAPSMAARRTCPARSSARRQLDEPGPRAARPSRARRPGRPRPRARRRSASSRPAEPAEVAGGPTFRCRVALTRASSKRRAAARAVGPRAHGQVEDHASSCGPPSAAIRVRTPSSSLGGHSARPEQARAAA